MMNGLQMSRTKMMESMVQIKARKGHDKSHEKTECDIDSYAYNEYHDRMWNKTCRRSC